MDTRQIFLSYSRDNANFAATLQKNLVSQRDLTAINAWIDSEQLRAGSDWQQQIDQAIRDSFMLIVVMSPSAKSSEYVTYEWSFALGRGLKVIPVIYKPTDLHPRLKNIQNLDFTEEYPLSQLATAIMKIEAETRNSAEAPVQTSTKSDLGEELTVVLEELLTSRDTAIRMDEVVGILAKKRLITSQSYAVLLNRVRAYQQRLTANDANDLLSDISNEVIKP